MLCTLWDQMVRFLCFLPQLNKILIYYFTEILCVCPNYHFIVSRQYVKISQVYVAYISIYFKYSDLKGFAFKQIELANFCCPKKNSFFSRQFSQVSGWYIHHYLLIHEAGMEVYLELNRHFENIIDSKNWYQRFFFFSVFLLLLICDLCKGDFTSWSRQLVNLQKNICKEKCADTAQDRVTHSEMIPKHCI